MKHFNHFIMFASLIFILMFLVPIVSYAQCAMCVTGLTNSQEGQQMARSFNTAILYLLPFPYLIAMTIAGIILRAHAQRQGMSLVTWLKYKIRRHWKKI